MTSFHKIDDASTSLYNLNRKTKIDRYWPIDPTNRHPGQCFLAAVFPCISCKNREETCSIWQEPRRKILRTQCNQPVTVYSCQLWQISVDSCRNRINPVTGSIHPNTAAMK